MPAAISTVDDFRRSLPPRLFLFRRRMYILGVLSLVVEGRIGFRQEL